MRLIKMAGLAAIAALAMMAFVGAGSASATALCKTPAEEEEGKTICFEEERYPAGTIIEGKSSEVRFGSATHVHMKCTESRFRGKTQATEATSIPVQFESWSFGGCTAPPGYTCTLTVSEPGPSGGIEWTGSNSGTLGETPFPSVTMVCGQFYKCAISDQSPVVFELNSTGPAGEPSTLVATEQPLVFTPVQGSCPFFGESTKLTATYEITAPKPLYVTP